MELKSYKVCEGTPQRDLDVNWRRYYN